MPSSYTKILYGDNLRTQANLDAGKHVEPTIRKVSNTCMRERVTLTIPRKQGPETHLLPLRPAD